MEQNKKVRLRLNLFDGIVLVVCLIAAIAMAVIMLTPEEVSIITPQTSEVTYTIRIRNATPEIETQINVGDALEDAVKNLDLGTVVSYSIAPSTETVLDEETLVYSICDSPVYVDVDLVMSASATMTEDEILLASSYRIRGDEAIYVRGPGYLGSGIVLSIDRGIAE